MADAGTLAGAEVAKQLGIPVCFSLAPDPHNVVQSLQRSGELDADSFVQLTSESHVWFRARLVERLAHDADRVALFPRVRPLEFFAGLGMDSAQFERRSAVVAEGIDLTQIERATIEHASATDPTLRQHDVLEELKDRLPEHRRQLPLLLSVGRLHPVKGMERVVRAWTGDSRLRELCNLVIIGGDLDEPSEIESAVLAEIDQILTDEDRPWPGFVMLGGRPRSDVTKLQVATALGNSGAWAGGGIYVDGALKEEFGLAVLEALAAGLVVVAPSTGGPATYVDHGDTGILAEPGADLAQAIHAAFELVNRPGRASRASALVRDRYSIDTMAEQLAELYRPVMALR
jgi:glycosyltransferase involved in cell wall biosynthesis